MLTNISPETSHTNIQKLLRPEQVAETLCISRSFVYHLLQSGEIPVVRLGKARRVRPQDLMDYIKKNTQSGICK